MTGIDHELETLAQQGDLASFCPHCHAALNVYDADTRRVWVGLDVEVGDVACDLLVNPRLEEFERVLLAVLDAASRGRRRALPALPRLAARGGGAAAASATSPVFTIEVSLHTRVAPLSLLHARGLPLARRAQAGRAPRSSPGRRGRRSRSRTRGCACATSRRSATATTASRPWPRRAAACSARSRPASTAARSASTSPGSSSWSPRATSPAAARRIREKNALPADLRPRLPAGRPVREAVPAGQEGRAARRRRARAVRRRLRARDRPGDAAARGRPRRAAASPWSAAGRPGSHWPPTWPCKGHSVTIFEALHNPGGVLVYGIPEFRLPKAHRRGRDRQPAASRRQVRAQQHRRQALRAHGALRPRLRRRVRGHRRRPARLHGPARREPLQHRLRQRVPHAREPDEGLPVPRVRHAGAEGHAGGGGRRRQRGHGLRAHGAAHGRARGRPSSTGARATRCRRARRRSSTPSRRALRFEYLTSPVAYEGDEQGWVRQMRCVRMKLGEPDDSGPPAADARARVGLPDRRGPGGRGRGRRPQQGPLRGRRGAWSATSAATSARSPSPGARACRGCGPAGTSSPAPRRSSSPWARRARRPTTCTST